MKCTYEYLNNYSNYDNCNKCNFNDEKSHINRRKLLPTK